VGAHMASTALTWARQHACLAAVSLSCMMLHISVADLDIPWQLVFVTCV